MKIKILLLAAIVVQCVIITWQNSIIHRQSDTVKEANVLMAKAQAMQFATLETQKICKTTLNNASFHHVEPYV